MITSLIRAHDTVLQFVFSEQEAYIMATLNIHKPITAPLELINVADASNYRIGCITTFSYVYHWQNTPIMFEEGSLQPRKHQKRTLVTTTSSSCTSRSPRVDTADDQKEEQTAAEIHLLDDFF